jgi:hypothetical protein
MIDKVADDLFSVAVSKVRQPIEGVFNWLIEKTLGWPLYSHLILFKKCVNHIIFHKSYVIHKLLHVDIFTKQII